MAYQFPFDEWLLSIPEWQRFMTVQYGEWIAEKEFEKKKIELYADYNRSVDYRASEIIKGRVEQEIGDELKKAEKCKEQQRLHWAARIKQKDEEICRLRERISALEDKVKRGADRMRRDTI